MLCWMSAKSSWKTCPSSVMPTHWPSTKRTPFPGAPQRNSSQYRSPVARSTRTSSPAVKGFQWRFHHGLLLPRPKPGICLSFFVSSGTVTSRFPRRRSLEPVPQRQVPRRLGQQSTGPLTREIGGEVGEGLLGSGVQLGRPEHVGVVRQVAGGQQFEGDAYQGRGFRGTGLLAQQRQQHVEVGPLERAPGRGVGDLLQRLHSFVTIALGVD